MAKPLTIIARIEAGKQNVDLDKSELRKLTAPTRREKGCLQYDLHQENDHPEVFVFYENWKSRELWQRHMNSGHIKAYMEATDGAVEDFTVLEMTRMDQV